MNSITRIGGNGCAELVTPHTLDRPRPRRAEAESHGDEITGCLSSVLGRFRPMV